MRAALLLLAACAATTPAPVTPQPATAPVTVPPAVSAAPSPLAQLEASRDLDNAVIGAQRTPTVVMLLASWCSHCRDELAVFDEIRAQHPHVRWLGLNYKAHEEYDDRGSSAAIHTLAGATRWMRIVPADDALFAAFGSPPKVPTIFVFDSRGTLVATFDRRERSAPREQELDDLLRSIDTRAGPSRPSVSPQKQIR